MASSSTPAMDAFLSTPELLESLFLECEIRQLLTAVQQVCRQWHDIINYTPSVQVHMFLRPARRVYRPVRRPIPSNLDEFDKRRSSSIASQDSSTSDSCLSASSTHSNFDDPTLARSTRSSFSSISSDDPQPQLKITPTPNPLLVELFGPFFTPYQDALCEDYYSRHDIEKLPLAKRPDLFLYEHASWRRMLLQQPPQESLGVSMPETGYSILYSRQNSRIKIAEDRGTVPKTTAHDGVIRMWDLYDTVLRGLTDPSLRWKVLWRPTYTLEDSETRAYGEKDSPSFSPSPSPNFTTLPEISDSEHTNTSPWPTDPWLEILFGSGIGTSPNLSSASSIFHLNPSFPSLFPHHTHHSGFPHREDLVGGCTSLLMHRGAEIIVVRRRKENEPFLGWSRFDEFQGRYVHPKWLGDKSGLERSGNEVVVYGQPISAH